MAGGTDDELITRYANGDVAAFEALYARHKGPLYRYFFRQFGNPDTADELFQDAWTRTIKARGRGDSKASFATDLYQGAHQCLMEQFRKAGGSLTAAEPPAEPPAEKIDPAFASARWSLVDWNQEPGGEASGPANPVEQRLSRLRSALAALSSEQREAFLLHEEAEMGLADIAAVTGANAEIVQGRLRDAVKKLGNALGAMPLAVPRASP